MIRQNIKFILGLLAVSTAQAAEKTYPTCSGESIAQVDRAITCWNRNDVGCTRLNVDQVLAHQPGCAQAMHLRSFLLEHDGRQEEAEALREKAVQRDPQLKDFWQERGRHIEDNFLLSQEFSRFRLRFHGGEARDKAWRAVQYLNEAYDQMTSHFGFSPVGKIEVLVFSGEEFVATWRSPYVGGFFDLIDGKVRVRVDEVQGGEEEYRRVCRHEFAHAFMYRVLGKELPLWFAEGTAEFYAHRTSSDSQWKEKLLEEYARNLRGQPWLTLAEIHTAIHDKKDGRRIALGYYYAHAFVLYVAKERGESWVPRVIVEMRKDKTIDQAFLDVVGVSAESMHERLRKSWE